MKRCTIDGHIWEGPDEAIYLDAVPTGQHPLAAVIHGHIVPLSAPITDGAEVRWLNYASEEGRRAYDRSLRFVLLMAVQDCFPGVHVRLENSFGDGVYGTIRGLKLTADHVRTIEKRMKEIVRLNLPFVAQETDLASAIAYYRSTGQHEKARLLTDRPYERFQFYECGGVREYFFGEMLPSTGDVPVFALRYYLPGFLLRMPVPDDPTQIAPFHDQPKLMKTSMQSAQWQEQMHCANAADINSMISNGAFHELVLASESLQEKRIGQIADAIRESGARLVAIAGPSSSGKTTFTHRLCVALRVIGLHPHKLSLDDYYLDREQLSADENGNYDFERIDTLDLPLLNEQLVALLAGEAVDTPVFDFHAHARTQQTHRIAVAPDQLILIEGIHALNPALTAHVPREIKYQIYVSALTMLNIDDHSRIRSTDARLLRRLVRDARFRNTPVLDTLQRWPSVRYGEDHYIFPYQENADVMFNSSLAYELPVLKKYLYPLLSALPSEAAEYPVARRLIEFLNYLRAAHVEYEIPPNSLLREFIGGSCFYGADGRDRASH